MKKYAIEFFIFCIPIIALFSAVYAVDIYSIHNKKDADLKSRIVMTYDNGSVSKKIAFHNNPTPNVIIGSSQLMAIKQENIPSENWTQLCVNGSNPYVNIDNFWYACNATHLDTVIFEISTSWYMNGLCTMRDQASYTHFAEEILNNPVKRTTSLNVIKASLEYLKKKITGDTAIHRGVPPVTQEKFWQQQLVNGSQRMGRTVISLGINSELQQIKDYCDSANIVLIPITPLIHSDLIAIAEPYYQQYFLKYVLPIFGEIYNFAVVNDYTSDRNNFADPFHCNADSIYIKAIWRGDSNYYQILHNNE